MVDKLIGRGSAEECTENINEVKIAEMALFEPRNECLCSCTICIILAVIALTISIGIGAYFACKCMNYLYLKKDVIHVKFGTGTQTTI